jgi:shikimate 5-dehydrogenase
MTSLFFLALEYIRVSYPNKQTNKQGMTSLSGRICLVTGASKGVGRGIALQLGSNGATVYITGRSEDKLETCAKEINDRGGLGKNLFKYTDHKYLSM